MTDVFLEMKYFAVYTIVHVAVYFSAKVFVIFVDGCVYSIFNADDTANFSYNHIGSVALQENLGKDSQLRSLDLSHNRISAIRKSSFSSFAKLDSLALSHNNIRYS